MIEDPRKIDWGKVKYFKKHEFECNCGCGQCNVNPQLVYALDLARSKSSVKFVISSGARCERHNKKEGGVPGSSHISSDTNVCHAADIEYKTPGDGAIILKALTPYFDRIGVGPDFIHVDNDPDKLTPALWPY